ncbi:uncharacterized protein CDAR_607671 [Caerostris darwini]|uniref:Uncharacterized protein n=1 Tax=Caerostris darwini TaxID=1538125 RepID=A0AAV4ULT6_9ARAC|nr:uncharacterized protein CDAR_607671 [Caerostris darwini]
MGCANSKTGATGAYGAPEEEAGAPPKVMVDGEAQDGAVAANGNAVSCANGAEGRFLSLAAANESSLVLFVISIVIKNEISFTERLGFKYRQGHFPIYRQGHFPIEK